MFCFADDSTVIVIVQMTSHIDINNNVSSDEHHAILEQLIWDKTLDENAKNQLFGRLLSNTISTEDCHEIQDEIQNLLRISNQEEVELDSTVETEVRTDSSYSPEKWNNPNQLEMESESNCPSRESDQSCSDGAGEPGIILR